MLGRAAFLWSQAVVPRVCKFTAEAPQAAPRFLESRMVLVGRVVPRDPVHPGVLVDPLVLQDPVHLESPRRPSRLEGQPVQPVLVPPLAVTLPKLLYSQAPGSQPCLSC